MSDWMRYAANIGQSERETTAEFVEYLRSMARSLRSDAEWRAASGEAMLEYLAAAAVLDQRAEEIEGAEDQHVPVPQ